MSPESHDAATRSPSGLNDGTEREVVAALEGEQLVAAGGVPHPEPAVVAGRGEHRTVVVVRDVVDVDVVAAERAQRFPGHRVADVDDARVLGPLGHEGRAVGAPVDASRRHRARAGRRGTRRPPDAALPPPRARAASLPAGRAIDRFEREQHRPLRIGLQVRDRCRRELAGDRDAALRVGAVALVDRDEAQHERDDQPGRDAGDQEAEAAIGPRLPLDPLRLFAPFLVARGSARVEELVFDRSAAARRGRP